MEIDKEAELIANESTVRKEIANLDKEIDVCNKIIRHEMQQKLKLLVKINELEALIGKRR